MSGGKQNQRQKLINMMYLVLTALLAINVSKEILDSFITIDHGQNNTRLSLEEKLSMRMDTFALRATDKPLKFAVPYEKANEISKEANHLIRHINHIKARCIAETEGKELAEVYDQEADTVLQIEYVERKDNYDVNTNILFGSGELPSTEKRAGDDTNYRASILKNRLILFREDVSSQISDEGMRHSLNTVFDYDNKIDSQGNLRPWEQMNFHNVPLAATHTILSKIQSDIRAAQELAINSLFHDVEGKNMKFTKLKEAVIPVTTTVSLGGKFQAEVFLAAYDDTNPPEIRLAKPGAKVDEKTYEIQGEYDLLDVDSSMIGNIELPGNSLGQKHREGVIIFKPAGLPEVRKKFVLDFNVVAPTLIASPTNMNVFYKGIDNPLTIGVPGFQASDITPRIDNGSLSRGSDGNYVVKVKNGTDANITVSVKLPDGSSRQVGPAKFRLKPVPTPEAKFAGKTASNPRASKAEVKAALGVIAASDFQFPVNFKVQSFDIGMVYKGQYIQKPSKGNKVSFDQQSLINNIKTGQKLDIFNIKVKSPDGRIMVLNPLILRIR